MARWLKFAPAIFGLLLLGLGLLTANPVFLVFGLILIGGTVGVGWLIRKARRRK